jgi:hypothetical protein
VQARKTKYTRALALAVLILCVAIAERSYAVPSFARQTGMACQACHTVFPELTPFGRSFKLNGYQIDNLPQVQGITTSKDYDLLLNQLPPLSVMFQASYTRTGQPLPDTAISGANSQNGQLLFPQQASLFYAGRIAEGLGAFIQMTYDSAAGNLHWDNTDIRYAKQLPLAADNLTLGLTLNNNPTVQDAWNSTPAWQTPFDQRTNAAPVPGASTMIDGVLTGQGVAGITAYAWWRNSLYGEIGIYRSSPQGFNVNDLAGPLDSTAGGALTTSAPYWRLVYEHQWNRNSLSIGTYGIVAKLSPPGEPIAPPTDRFRDVALDGQYQYIGDEHIFSVQSTYIKEHQSLDASFALGAAENPSDDLKTFRIAGSYYFQRRFGASLGRFTTTGSTDVLRYPSSPVFGFANGSPDSKGWIGELEYIPWQNVKLVLQYTAYQKFNGDSSNYDGNGRSAKDNNTLYLLGWLAF